VGELIIAGVPASIVIVSLVQIAKGCGMPRRYAPLLAIVLGIAVTVAIQVAVALPWLRVWWEALGAGLMLGLSACGLYSGGKSMIVSKASGARYREAPDGSVVEGTARMAVDRLHADSVGEPPAQIGPGGRWQ
jgi:hypothetical protein